MHILNERGNIALLNHAYTGLIPQIKRPKRVVDFRCSSLCNDIYIVIVKTIASRLKQIFHFVISSARITFIPNRFITNNIIIGYKCLYKIRHSKRKKRDLGALKLDITKVYGKMEQSFLKSTMEMFGFSSKWVGFIMRYITTPFLMLINEIAQAFLMLINEIVPGLIQPQRGLRQGYLFVFICIYIMCRGFLKSSHPS